MRPNFGTLVRSSWRPWIYINLSITDGVVSSKNKFLFMLRAANLSN